MLVYPVTLSRENGSVLVRVPDFPEADSVGADEDRALLGAVVAIDAALNSCFDQQRPVPMPSKARKEQPAVTLSALKAAKVMLWNEMQAQNLTKAELAGRLNVHPSQVDRLFDLNHPSEFDFIELAAKALGKTFEVALV